MPRPDENPVLEFALQAMKDKTISRKHPDAILFHIGPIESMELADELGFDFISYCGTTVIGSSHGGDWQQPESNAVCRTCFKGIVTSAIRNMAGREDKIKFGSL
jgi:hypothetical protein